MVRSHSRQPFISCGCISMPVVTLPDGSQRRFDQPVTVDEVAASIGAGPAQGRARRARRRQAGRHLVRHRRPTPALAIVTEKDPDGLEVIRHSTAHLLAQAVKELFPEAQVTIGPVIEDGFYYDFAFERPFTPEDLAAIEAKMKELAKADQKVDRRVMARDEAVRVLQEHGRALQGRDHRQHSRRRSRSASTARATGSTCAAARTCRPPASSRPSSS